MIPKKIHYCWFGGKPMPKEAEMCIESWKKYCPDYEIQEWNETNFDINSCDYVKEAFEAQKWAFITDYVRLKVMVEHGGIYMDTDVEVLKSLDEFLVHQAFSGFEKEDSIPTGIMACEKGYSLFAELLSEYNSRHFINTDGSLNMTTNVKYITDACLKHGLRLDNSFQEIDGFTIYPKDYFCPKNYATGRIELTDRSYTIHHFASSWLSTKGRIKKRIRALLTDDQIMRVRELIGKFK